VIAAPFGAANWFAQAVAAAARRNAIAPAACSRVTPPRGDWTVSALSPPALGGRPREGGPDFGCHGRVSFSVGLADGRLLEASVSGPDQATPLVFHHGTPSERTQYRPFAEAAAVRGLRLVSYSRPGYGGSSRQPGRVIADCAADTLTIVEQLGIGRFYTAGWSGGGPYTPPRSPVASAPTHLDTELRALARRARLVLAPPAGAAAPTAGASTPAAPLGLTPREVEVLALLAAGRSNHQIAQALFISPKTASVHVSNILAKLGVAGRVEAAAIAHRLGLN
jgi:DNA-binding CsgD family transcriptional regulator